MLIRLLPEQVSEHWQEIRPAIEGALPPTSVGGRMQNVLSEVLTDKLKVWVNFYEKEGKKIFNGVVTTSIIIEIGTGSKSLLIYTVFGYNESSQRDWMDGLATLRKYAKAEECTSIVAYSNIDNVIAMASRLGADTSYRLISFSI